MRRDTKQIHVVLTGGRDSDDEELETLTIQLRDQLLELDVERVEWARLEAAPVGARPGEAVALGALVVTVAPIVLRAVLSLMEKWIEHRPVRTVSITIGDDTLELQAVSAVEQQRLIDAFVAAHSQTLPNGAESGPSSEPATRSMGEG